MRCLSPEQPSEGGPRLPPGCQPRRVNRPPAERGDREGLFVEHWDEEDGAGSGQHCFADEDSSAPPPFECSPHAFEDDEEGTHSCSKLHKPFQRLLLEIAAEHRREVKELKRELARRKTSEVHSAASGCSPRNPSKPVLTKAPSQFTAFSLGSLVADHSATKPRPAPMDFALDASLDLPSQRKSVNGAGLLQTLRGFTIRRAVLHPVFDMVSSAAIILNSVLYGWFADAAVVAAFEDGSDVDDHLAALSKTTTIVFSTWFAVEVLMRMCATGMRSYLCGEARCWNLFDAVVVGSDLLLSLLEALEIGAEGFGNTLVRMLRILRITRAVRVVRLVRFFRELRMMVFSILRSGSALLWSLVLLGCTIYIFAIYFVQIVAIHFTGGEHRLDELHASSDEGDEFREEVEVWFGSLLKAEYTLYQAVSGGVDWGDVASVLIQIHSVHAAVFCFFIFFTTLTMLNIITGIFVETAINTARTSQEEAAQDHLYATAELAHDMKKLFREADHDSSGTVSLYEFENYLDRKEVRAYLQSLGIEIDNAKGLFRLLDVDMSGEITLEEFTFGCLRLKGGAKSIDLAALMNHNKRMAQHWRKFFAWTQAQWKHLHAFEERMERRLALLDDGE